MKPGMPLASILDNRVTHIPIKGNIDIISEIKKRLALSENLKIEEKKRQNKEEYLIQQKNRKYQKITNQKQAETPSKLKLKFDNLSLKELPIDPIEKNFVRTVSGYQFGSFSGQLGDGRAIYLGEVIKFVISEFREEYFLNFQNEISQKFTKI